MDLVLTLERLVVRLTRATAVLGLVLLLALAGMTVVDGMMRWLANQPIDGVRDVGALIIANAVAASLPVVLAERANITVEFAASLFGRFGARLCNVVAGIVVLVVMAAMAWQFQLFTNGLARAGQTTWVLQWKVAPFWQATTVLIALCVPVQAVVVLRDIARLTGADRGDEQA